MNTKFVDMVLSFFQRIPVPIHHNLEKALTIKKLMFQLNVDGTLGDYFEFGVAQGNSIKASLLARKHAKYDSLGIRAIPRKIYGFDTFQGFSSDENLDQHHVWQGNLYNHSFERVKKRFRKVKDLKLFQIDVCVLAQGKNEQIPRDFFGIPQESIASLILMDMDLYAPTKSALVWMKSFFQNGTFIMFDEWHGFAGKNERGERRALLEFLDENKELHFDYVCDYGAGGRVFVIQTKRGVSDFE